MRELTEDEVAQVSGGLNPLILLGVAGSMFAFGYSEVVYFGWTLNRIFRVSR